MTTATGSITDSTAWGDIPEKPHQPVNYSVSQAHIWGEKMVSHTFQHVCYTSTEPVREETSVDVFVPILWQHY